MESFYQIVTFLEHEPQISEPVYYGNSGWFPQLALKRRFKLNDIMEDELVELLGMFFSAHTPIHVQTGALTKPDTMPVRVIDIMNQAELKNLHEHLIAKLGNTITSRFPERDGSNYYPHITAEHDDSLVIDVDHYVNRELSLDNVWLLKDVDGPNSQAYIKIR